MRLEVFALSCLSVGALALAAADPPAAIQSERPAAPAAVAPDSAAPATNATTSPPPAAPSPAANQPAPPKATQAALSADEQRVIKMGYKPRMRNGEKIYCRREAVLGSRIGGTEHCGTVDQLTTATHDGRDYVDQAQRSNLNPTIK